MTRLVRLSLVLSVLAILGACVVVPAGPRRVYYGPPAVVQPVGVVVVRR